MTNRFLFIFLGAVALFLTACDPPAAQQTIVVDTTTDTADLDPGDGICLDGLGQCSLRAAVMEANANPNTTEIQLVAGNTYTLTLAGSGEDASATGDLDITERTYIRSYPVGQPNATIDAAGLDRAIHVLGGDFSYLERLTITGGNPTGGNNAGDGGAIFHRAGLLGIEDTHITGNAAGARGGGIASWGGTLWIEDSTISNNAANSSGKGIFLGIGGYARLFQTTIADHPGTGGAIHFATAVNAKPTDILWSTITDADDALQIQWGRTNVAHSVIGGDCFLGPNSTHTSQHSVYSTYNCPAGTGDLQDADLGLTPLADYGGQTPTRHPVVGSNPIDFTSIGTGQCEADLPPDARGEDRPSAAGCDAGAVEAIPFFTPGSDCVQPPNLDPGAELDWCNLTGVGLLGEDLTNASLRFANLAGVNLTGAIFENANLTGARLSDTTGTTVDFTGATLRNANLTDADYTGIHFSNADLTNATLVSARFDTGDFSDAIFIDADLRFALFRDPTLVRADLTRADLSSAVFIEFGNLDDAIFVDATLDDATMSLTSLERVDFTNATFIGASLVNNSFDSAIFTNADLTNADLSLSILTNATITNATWNNTTCPNGTNSNVYSPQTCENDLS